MDHKIYNLKKRNRSLANASGQLQGEMWRTRGTKQNLSLSLLGWLSSKRFPFDIHDLKNGLKHDLKILFLCILIIGFFPFTEREVELQKDEKISANPDQPKPDDK